MLFGTIWYFVFGIGINFWYLVLPIIWYLAFFMFRAWFLVSGSTGDAWLPASLPRDANCAL